MSIGAYICDVIAESPADDAGFVPGCRITQVDGCPLRDAIDWRWLSSEDEIELSYVDDVGDEGTVVLEREPGEDWGFVFDDVIFDDVRLCRNACTFCFMRQLPPDMRASLSMRDDDFRLSFLTGTFVTMTNLTDADCRRIIEQRISPLRVSLHAVDPAVRRSLIGRHAQAGLDNLERLLDAGIEFDAQIVLVPDVNDRAVLDETLAWAYARPGIRTVGIVPLGFTRYQDAFDKSFDDPADARRVIEQVERFQKRAMAERGEPWVHAADELYRNAYGTGLLAQLPDAGFYGAFEMYQDGIGIIRSAVDDFRAAVACGAVADARQALEAAGACAVYVTGEAMQPYIGQLVEEAGLAGCLDILTVENEFFGGNVNVTGLLTGRDIARAIAADARRQPDALPQQGAHQQLGAQQPGAQMPVARERHDAQQPDARKPAAHARFYLVPDIVFNADEKTLDDWTFDDITSALVPEIGDAVHVVSTNPIDYLQHITQIASS